MALFDSINFSPSGYSGLLGDLLSRLQFQQPEPSQGFPDSMGSYGGIPYPIFGQPEPATTELSAQARQPMQPQSQPMVPPQSGGSNFFANAPEGSLRALIGGLMGQPTGIRPTDDIREFEYAKRQGFQGTLADWMTRKRAGAGEYGLQPIWGVDKDGKPAVMQLGKNGIPIQSQIPPGFSIARDPIKVDAGTHFVLLDPQTRQAIGTVPKNLREAATEKEIGTEQGKARQSLPTDLLAGEQTVKQIDELLGNKGLDSIVGPLDQFRPSIALGAEGRDALARFNQLKGRAFLQAYSTLRGGGQITEVEGLKAENAMARMNRNLSEPEFRQALTDFRDAVRDGIAKLRERAGVAPAVSTEQPQSAAPSAMPKIDEVRDGYRFRGGNPADPNSWIKVK